MLCLDVGNTHIYGGVFRDDEIVFRFRCTSLSRTADETGIFLRQVLQANACDLSSIQDIAICSVVPQLDYSLRSACLKYFSIDPFFLQPGVRTGLKIKYSHPSEVGADRIANAVASVQLYPDTHCIIIDFGTATTFCAVSATKEYYGGAILPGVRLAVEALAQNTAKLPVVEIIKPAVTIGRSTIESIQSGVYFGMLGACRELILRMKREKFGTAPVKVIATGGFASLFEGQQVYDVLLPDLVLQGIRCTVALSRK
jgi:type III pantothenate kinase